MLQSYILGMLGSLTANLVTRPTEKMIVDAEKVGEPQYSKIIGQRALGVAGLILAGSGLYLFITRKSR